MKLSRKNYFSAIYFARQASTYFNRVLMVSTIIENKKSKAMGESLFDYLKENGQEYVNNLRFADSIYNSMRLPKLELPKVPDDYFIWIKDFSENMKQGLAPNSPEEHLYSLAANLGNLHCSASVLSWALLIHANENQAINQEETIKKMIVDIKSSKFVFAAPAMLLGKNKETSFVWDAWKKTDEALNQFLLLVPEEMPTELSAAQTVINEQVLPSIQQSAKEIMDKLI